MKNIIVIGISLCLLSITSAGPVLKNSESNSDDVNDLAPIAIEAQELPVEKIDNVQMNVGKMLERSLARFSLDDLVHGFHESVNHNVKPILDRLGHFRLSELIKHLKNKPIFSHVVGDEKPTTIEVVVHKPNGHHETIFSIPHKKFLHKFDKFHKPEEEHHSDEQVEEHVEEHVEEGHQTEIELKPVIDYTSQVYTSSYGKPVVVDHQGRGVADAEEYDESEDTIYKPLKRDRRDTTTIHYPEENDDGWAPEEDGKVPQKTTRPNEVTDTGKVPAGSEGGHEDLTLEQVFAGTAASSAASSAAGSTSGPVKEPSKTPTKPQSGDNSGVPTGVRRPTKRPEKFVVTVEEHPLTSAELLPIGPEEDPNVEYQDEFTAQELMQFAYKWLRKNVVFRV